MKGREAVAGALISATLLTSVVAVEYRSAPTLFAQGYDRIALRHVDDGTRHSRTKKRKRFVMDPRTDTERGIDQLDARIRLLWAKVERLESKLLQTGQKTEDERANA